MIKNIKFAENFILLVMKKIFLITLISLFFINFYSCDSLLDDITPEETVSESSAVTPAVPVQPGRNTIRVPIDPILKWTSGQSTKQNLLSFDIYIDTSEDVRALAAKDVKETELVLQNKLIYNTTYYWKVVSKIPGKSVDSEVFTFTTEPLRIPVLSVNIENSDFRLSIGLSRQLDFNLNPSNSTNKKISWSSDKPSIADVDENGIVRGLSAGTAIIKVTSSDSETSDTVTVIIINPNNIVPTSVNLDRASASISVSTSLRLTATVIPQNATNKNVSWSSSNPNIATVQPDGTVTGVQNGSAIITVTTEEGDFKAEMEVIVGNIAVTGIELIENNKKITSKELTVGDTYQITPRILPQSATVKAVTYRSVKPEFATVSTEGLVTAVAIGNTIIDVITQDGAIEVKLVVKVIAP